MFGFLFKKHGTGGLPDDRPVLAKSKDYLHAEIASASVASWVEKPPNQWRGFPIRNQDGSSSCVWYATAKALGIENDIEEGEYVLLSPRDGYSDRANKPQEGTFFPDAMEHARKFGITLEALLPSENKNEADMNKNADRKTSHRQVAKVFKPAGWFSQMSFEEVASMVINEKKGVVLGFRFNYDEWTDIPTIKTNNPTLGHAVTCVDAALYQGKKYLVIEDQWGQFGSFAGRRLISLEFFTARCFWQSYFLPLKNDWQGDGVALTRPKYNFTAPFNNVTYNKPDVVALQNILKYEGLFPYDQESTGVYGGLTSAGVLKFQKRHKVAPDNELDPLLGQKVGPKTIETLNRLYPL